MGNKKYNDPTMKHTDTETWYKIRRRLTSVKMLAADGATNQQIASFLGVSMFTLKTYRKRYKELDEALTLGRDKVVEQLEQKLYKKAMGIVDNNVTRVITTELTEEEEDPSTGVITEVTKTKTKRVNVQESGFSDPDVAAAQFLLKNLAPEKYNVQPVVDDNKGIEPVTVVNDIPIEVIATEQPKLFYDDSADVESEVDTDAGKSN